MPAEQLLDGARRAMRVAQLRELDRLEGHLAMLATVGSTSPYVGLFGTVWGIMSAFHNLGNVQQATLAAVAPGIAEALVTTAVGLFAAIPAVIAYNRLADQVSRLELRFDTFVEEFSTILQRHGSTRAQAKPMPAPQRRRRLMGEINVVPYIDVMLVLLIIFMITAPLLKEGVKVDLPDAGAKPIDADFLQKHEPLILTIDAGGRLYINFGQNQDQPVSGVDGQFAHGRASAPRSADPGSGQGRYHGALWHRGARHGAAAEGGGLEGGVSDRSGAQCARPARGTGAASGAR